MHALLLAVALGQATPATPSTTPAAEPPTTATATPDPVTSPDPVPVPPPESPPPSPPTTGAVATSAPRPVELIRLPGGRFQATLDGQPVSGADFYRAVLRPDLAARVEQVRSHRTALLVSAAAAPLMGLGIGWAVGASQQWPLPPCYVDLGPGSCPGRDQVSSENRFAMQRALLVGAGVGLSAGVLLAVIGRSVHPPEPTAEEAEALVRAYRFRTGPMPSPAPIGGRPGAGAGLDLQAGPGSVRLALRVGF